MTRASNCSFLVPRTAQRETNRRGIEALDPHGRERTEDKRNIWRVEEAKLQEFIDESYRKTAEAIATGEVDDEPAED